MLGSPAAAGLCSDVANRRIPGTNRTPLQTLQLASELARQGSNYGVIIYPEDNHILSHHREDRDSEVTQWFKSFFTVEVRR